MPNLRLYKLKFNNSQTFIPNAFASFNIFVYFISVLPVSILLIHNHFKKTILFDLDGVLNTYDGNFDPSHILPIKQSAFELIKELSSDYKIVIFTTRNSLLASKWVTENGLDDFVENITSVKEPAYLLINDRCINFDGDYKNLKDKIAKFQVWYKKIITKIT